ncbi:MAG: hypothetical protein POELPBGB_03979 [Bacteroidia bacterium]|nr:hypothetical protein [Bacteroidia bacterium]
MSIGRTLSAEKPIASIFWLALTSSGNSNGVCAANCWRSLRKSFAFSPEPSIVVNPMRACSIWELKPIMLPAAASQAERMTPTAACAERKPAKVPAAVCAICLNEPRRPLT